MCLKESYFPDCQKISLVVSVFKNVGERSTAKNYHPAILLSVVSKVFEKLVNNRIVDHQEKCGLFSDFQYGFRSSQSTADLLTVVSDRIASTFNRSRATRAVDLIHPRLLTEFGMLVFFTNLSLMEFQVRYLALFPSGGIGGDWGGIGGGLGGGSPPSTQKIGLSPPPCLPRPTVLTQKCHFCHFHAAFGHFVQIVPPPLINPNWETLLMILLPTLNVIRHLICGNN